MFSVPCVQKKHVLVVEVSEVDSLTVLDAFISVAVANVAAAVFDDVVPRRAE